MQAVDKLTIQVLVDNIADPLSSRPEHVDSEFVVLRENGLEMWSGESLCSAHHGLSLVLTVEKDGQQHSVLFDGGPEAAAIERNGPRLGIDFGKIGAVVLSHGHYDHSEGLPQAIQMIHKENGQQPIPLYVHPEAFTERGVGSPERGIVPLMPVPPVMELEQLGAQAELSSEPQEILDGTFFISGEIPRNSFEGGLPGHYRKTEAGEWELDPLVIDERFLAVHLQGKGLVVMTGCSHAGIVNVLHHAKRLFPDVPLYGLVGGLHLVGPNEDLIPETIAEIRTFGLKAIIAGHCTGWRGVQALVQEFGEGVVAPLAVGSRYRL